MDLIDLKNYFYAQPKGKMFNYGLSEPFSWRGSYTEVAFEVMESKMSREDILKNIEKAYEGSFGGYKGGEFEYGDYTPVNFEEDYSRWTDGGYCARLLAKLEGSKTLTSNEDRLINLAFE